MENSGYWKNQLLGTSTILGISPTDLPTTNNPNSLRKSTTIALDDTFGNILPFCDGQDFGPEDVLLAAYYILIYRTTEEKDIVNGLVNNHLLPMQISLTGNETFLEFIGIVKDKSIEIVKNSGSFTKDMLGDFIIRSSFSTYPQIGQTYLDFVVNCPNKAVHIHYDANALEYNTILNLSLYYKEILNKLISSPECTIGRVDILSNYDDHLYNLLNDTKMCFDHPPAITPMFIDSVNKYSDNIAISSHDVSYTYKELNQYINRIANMLIEKEVTKGDFVSILLDRSIGSVVALMAVMKVGGVYVPLDPDHPKERNLYIINDTDSKFILTKIKYKDTAIEMFGQSSNKVIYLEDTEAYSDAEPPSINDRNDLAYIIYTSGSTGNPKGALISHGGVMNLCPSIRDTFNITSSDILVQFASFSFDASVYEMFGAFYCGAHLHLINDEERMSVTAFADMINKRQITCVPLVPTVFFNQIASYLPEEYAPKLRSLRVLATGGEALTREAALAFLNRFGDHMEVINLYGPTECTAVTSSYRINSNNLPPVVPIGKPYYNYEMYIVNEFDKLCPTGVPGEILISSIGVANGYLHQPEKTAQAFINDPFNNKSGKKFYRTGDIARLSQDGNIEYISRKDSQIKVRGFRIEIGEIEDTFAKYATIQDVAVIPRKGNDGNNELTAFYSTTDNNAINTNILREFLVKRLPKYMIPSQIIFLVSLPVSPTGKIDRKILANMSVNSMRKENVTIVRPIDSVEKLVLESWRKVLKEDQISMTDNFFDIGGHSLKVIESLVMLKPYAPKLKIADFFKFQSAILLSNHIKEINRDQSTSVSILPEIYDPIELSENKIPVISQAKYQYIKPQSILLTGSTGFLGSHILYQLLRHTTSTIYCMTRNGNKQRLYDIMENYFGREINNHYNRITMIKGDFQVKNLGMSVVDRELISHKVDNIIHCGAEVRHHGDVDHFRKVNIDSTKYLIDFIYFNPNIRFHYISTLGVVEDLATEGKLDNYITNPLASDSISLNNVYTNSKFGSEKIVHKAISDGYGAYIYRMGNLVGDSINGKFQSNIDDNAFYRMLKAMILLQRAPRVDCYVDLTPIDYASAALIKLIFNDNQPQIFHICNTTQTHYRNMIKGFVKYGYRVKLIEPSRYSKWLLNSSTKNIEGQKLAIAQLEGDGAKNSPFHFSNVATQKLLSGLTCPTINQRLFSRLIEYAISTGYFTYPEMRIEHEGQIIFDLA